MSESWREGYVSDIGYNYSYNTTINPLHVSFAMLCAGYAPPQFDTACELAFGQSISLNLHAAGGATKWWGTDFNAGHVAFAREMMTAANSGIELFENSFADFNKRDDLPDFDFIVLAGTWSWVSDENRATIIEFIRRKLKPGGVYFNHYDTTCWASVGPFRKMLLEHAEIMRTPGQETPARIKNALQFANNLLEAGPAYGKANPTVSRLFNTIKSRTHQSLRHEYFTPDWCPMDFSDMARWLEPADLDYVCPVRGTEQLQYLNLSKDQIDFLNEIPDQIFRETVRDFITNQRTRREYWVKGATKLSTQEQHDALAGVSIMLTSNPDDISGKVKTSRGEFTLAENVFKAVVEVLSDQKPKTIGDVEQALKPRNVNFVQAMRMIMVMNDQNHLFVVQDAERTDAARVHTDGLNRLLLEKMESNPMIAYMASPLLGGGIPIAQITRWFLMAHAAGHHTAEALVNAAWERLVQRKVKIKSKGKTLNTKEENIKHLEGLAKIFIEKQVPVYQRVGII